MSDTTTTAEDAMTTPAPEPSTTLEGESSTTTEATGEAQETTTEATGEAQETTPAATDAAPSQTESTTETESPTETPTEPAASTTEGVESTTTAEGNGAVETGCSLGEGATRTISEQLQTTDLAGCSTFSGSLAVATDYQGALLLNDIVEITGDLSAIDVPGLVSLAGDSLAVVGGQLHLESLNTLEKVDFGALMTVETLNLTSIHTSCDAGDTSSDPCTSFDLHSLQNVPNFYIHDSTMQHLDGINVVTVKILTITNNENLVFIKLPDLTSVTESILISENGVGADVEFNVLESVGESISISQAGNVQLPMLASGGAMTLNSNNFTTLSLSDLKDVTLFELYNNTELTSISAPSLVTIGGQGVNITENNNLNNTISFQTLTTLAGGTFEGNYEAIELDSLTSVTGDLFLQSTKNIKSTCSQFEADVKNTAYKVTCDYPGSSSSNKGATIGGSVGGVVGFFIVVGVLVVGGYFWWMRRKGRGGRSAVNGRTFGDHGFELSNQRRRNYQSA